MPGLTHWTHPVIINQDCHSVKKTIVFWVISRDPIEKMDGSKNRGVSPKMDGENHGKPYEQMDDLGGVFPLFSETSKWFKGFEVGKPLQQQEEGNCSGVRYSTTFFFAGNSKPQMVAKSTGISHPKMAGKIRSGI